MKKQIEEIMKKIEVLSKDLGYEISKDDYYIEDLGCPHCWPKKLPEGYAAIYFFFENGKALKIGKANYKSKARFTSQHYRVNSAKSTLAKSLLNDKQYGFNNEEDVRDWLLKKTQRINVFVKAEKGKAATELIESIMHYYFRPKYEGAI